MADTHKSAKTSTSSNTEADSFTPEERAAMTDRAKEMKAAKNRKAVGGTAEVLEKIGAMAEADRVLAERICQLRVTWQLVGKSQNGLNSR